MLISLLLIPIIGIFMISTNISYNTDTNNVNIKLIKFIGLTTSIINLILSLIIFIIFDFSSNQYQFVQEYYEIKNYDFFLGIDGLSIYFVLLTTIIMPISLISN
jgi:NADH:ubiquinone oxidoreductase subunit 4 (subunit M)